MALPWAVINRLLESDVLAACEKVEGAKRGGAIGGIEDECAGHAPRACQTQPVRLGPARGGEGGAKLLERSNEPEIDWVTGQPVSRDGEARHQLALQHLKAHANGARQDDVGRDSIGGPESQNPRQPAVGNFENHKDDQPDTEDAQTQDQQALQEAFKISHDQATISFGMPDHEHHRTRARQ